jgi:hypothetical protein
MNALTPRGYRFRTPAQWSACLFDRVDQISSGVLGTLEPIAPFERSAHLYRTQGAYAPAATRAGEMLWRDAAGCLHRITACEDEPLVGPAPHAIAQALRLVPTSSGLWVIDKSGASLQRFDEESLT